MLINSVFILNIIFSSNITMIGSIYKIESDCGSIVYIGSTVRKLYARYSQHKKQSKCIISKYLKDNNYSFSNKCELLKEYEVVDRSHLFAYEQLWINKFKNCINVMSAFQILKKEKHKEICRVYRKNNADKERERVRVYRDNNIKKEKKRHKLYYDNNKQRIKERKQTKILCECGSISSKHHISRHIKSKKHQSYLESKKDLIQQS